MSSNVYNKFDVLQKTATPKRRKKINHQKNNHHKSTKNHKNNNKNNERTRFIFASFDEILNAIAIRHHNNCHNNSCCSIHCDVITCKYQSSYLRITLHLSNLKLNDKQLITITNKKIIPLLTKHIKLNNKNNNPIIIAIYLNENLLCGDGCIPLLNFTHEHNFRIAALQLYKNSISDNPFKQICDIFRKIKYPPNEIVLSHNKLTNIGFNCIINVLKIRNDNNNMLSYPMRFYKINFEPLMQNKVPLWLRIDNNYINIKSAKEYMNLNDISVCYAMNHKRREKHNKKENNVLFCCEMRHCIMNHAIEYYQNELNKYITKQMDIKNRNKFMTHSNSKCKTCNKERKKKGKKHNKIVLCKKCREKAKLIDREIKEEKELTIQLDNIVNDTKLTMDHKIEAMEQISETLNNENKKNENNFNKTVINNNNNNPWIWGEDSDESENKNENKIKIKHNDETLLENEYFIQSICNAPNDYTIAHIHLHKFEQQFKQAMTNEKVGIALEEMNENKNENNNINNNNNNDINRIEYENNMIYNSVTPLFIMCDTCSILRMVALTKKSAMNYWETMLTHKQKMEYILHFTKRNALQKEKFFSHSEMYERQLRIEILPALQLHLNTNEIKEIAQKLLKIPFKNLVKNKNKHVTYCDKNERHSNIIICQMYRFIALYSEKLPVNESEKDNNNNTHIWQDIIEKDIFNAIGYECPQPLIAKFIREMKKYSKQYEYQSKLETAKIFTLNTLIEKTEMNEFGFNNNNKKEEQTCILIPHTVTLELEHIKNMSSKSNNSKSKGDLWRVQKLCGSNGLLEILCKKSGCDILGSEHGESHIHIHKNNNNTNNDSTIISIAQYYSGLLNKENNFGFVLITNDKAMYTIASGKGIPVVSLNTLNKQLQKDAISTQNTNIMQAWNATYLRTVFIKVGFVAGFAEKHLINNAVHILSNNENKNKNKNENETLIKELEFRRKQVALYMAAEQGYACELFSCITLTNNLIVTLKDILQNRDSTVIMRQIYENKVNSLELTVRNSHHKWSKIIQDFQLRNDDKNNNNKNKSENKSDSDDIAEINTFHADDMNKVYGNSVHVYDMNVNEKKEQSDYESENESDNMPPPLNEDDQQKLLQIKQNINNNDIIRQANEAGSEEIVK